MLWPASGSAASTRKPPAGQAAPLQRDNRDAGEPLELEPGMRVRTYRGIGLNRDRRENLARLIRIESQVGDLPDADPVEQDGGARQETRDRVFEADEVYAARGQAGRGVQPVDEPEHRADRGDHEQSDDDIRRADFHLSHPQF
jgi:hypothetical protein